MIRKIANTVNAWYIAAGAFGISYVAALYFDFFK